jgi:UTP---glucose-1-phosphate uridylyltransferase
VHIGREAALIRQISNPMASTDCTLLALAGIGHRDGRAFGFASCNRCVGAAEGMNVLREARHHSGGGLGGARTNGAHVEVEGGVGVEFEYGVTNVEYTEFQRLGIKDQAVREGSNESAYPANTNILYVGARVEGP